MSNQPTDLSPELRIALGDQLHAFAEEKVTSGAYPDAAGVLRAALALMEIDESSGPGLSDAEIRALVEQGDASGESDENPDAFSIVCKPTMPPGPRGNANGHEAEAALQCPRPRGH